MFTVRVLLFNAQIGPELIESHLGELKPKL